MMLREAVESVLAQSYRPIEIIIVDDGSTDDTSEAICQLKLANPDIVSSLRIENSGPGIAREAGRQRARGEFIQYLDSDDLLLPRKFDAQVAALNENPDCGIAYGKTQFVRVGYEPDPAPLGLTGSRNERLFPLLLVSRLWSTNTPLFRRSLVDRIGPWQPLVNEEDLEYEARAALLGARLCYCDEFVSVTRSHQPNDHLCYLGSSDPKRLRDRARARELIFGHAVSAGIGYEQPEMKHFARALFLLSRQCGAVGLSDESRRLFHLSRQASGKERAQGLDFRLYSIAANLIGWEAVGRFSDWLDRLDK